MNVSLSAQHMVKRYGGVTALADGNVDVQSGQVLALMGANGSGKSTLSKIITGVVAPDSGTLTLDGVPTRFASPQEAQRHGVVAVYQELSLVPDMTVAENIWLAHEPIGWGRVKTRDVRVRTEALLALFAGTTSPALHPNAMVASLPPDEKQIVEILKALSLQPRVIILDESTASLDSRQVERLFELVAQWKTQGMAVIFVSHRMEEVFQLCDRATVLRSGQTVGSAEIAQITAHDLVEMMIAGGAVARQRAAAAAYGPLRVHAEDIQNTILHGVSLKVHAGELLGLGGLQGQGQAEVLLALFGAVPFSGRVLLGDKPVHFMHPHQAMEASVAFVPGDRGREGLLPVRSILENMHLPSWHRYGGFLNMSRAKQDAGATGRELRLVMSSLDAPVDSLSGGNAQKVVIGKWLMRKPQLLLLNDPTKGVDVGAKGDFYALLDTLREAGTAIILYSSDDEELLGLSDRVLVLHDGQVCAELSGADLNRAALVAASMGSVQRSAA